MFNQSEIEFICTGQQEVPDGFSIHECSMMMTTTESSSFPPSMSSVPYSMWTRILMTFIFSSLSVVGVVGNVLVITVVFRVQGMMTPTNCYLVSLAVGDLLFFIATAPTELSYLHSSDYIFGSLGCAFFSYLPYLAINSSSLSITAFTIERFIGICYPYKARSMCTVSRAILIICCIWTFSILYNSPWLYLASLTHDEEGDYCSFKLHRDNWTYQAVYLIDFFVFYTIPMLLNIFIYAKIAITLSQCSDKLKQSTKPRQIVVEKKNTSTDSTPVVLRRQDSEVHVSGRRGVKGKNQVVKMLALVVIVFACCWLPYRAMVMYNSFASTRWDPEWYIFFSKTMIFANCAVNPILYHLMSGRFRLAFKQLLSGNKEIRQRNASMYRTRVTLAERQISRRTSSLPTEAAGNLLNDADNHALIR